MKKLLVLVVCLVGTLGLQAQTVTFANLAAGVNAPIFTFFDDCPVEPSRDPSTGTRLPGGSEYLVQLVVLQGDSWINVGEPATILGNGLFNGGGRTVPGIASGAEATLAVIAWKAEGEEGVASYTDIINASAQPVGEGWFGISGPVTVATGGVGTPPTPGAALVGLESFAIYHPRCIPEPSTIALGLLGGALLFLRRRR